MEELKTIYEEINQHLLMELIPCWNNNCCDDALLRFVIDLDE